MMDHSKNTGHEKQRRDCRHQQPPITALPIGALSELLIDIGIMPTIMASAVIMTGRIRSYPASNAALRASP